MYDIVLCLVAMIFIVVCLWYARSGYFSVYHPFTLYLAFHGFLFVFRPIIARALDYHLMYRVYGFQPTESDKTTAILVATVGMLSFAFFSFRQGNLAMRFANDRISMVERQKLIPPFLAAAVICFPIGFYSLINSWNDSANATSLASMVIDKTTHIAINSEGNGYIKEAQLMLASCGAILAWLFRFRLLAVLPLATFIVMRAGTGGRGPFVAGAATLGLLWLYDHRQKWPSPRVMLGVVLMIAAFNVVGDDRGRSIRRSFGSDNTVAKQHDPSVVLRPLEGMDFANLEFLEYVIYTVPQRTHTYSYFTEELMLFTEPVPRALWPGKPVGPPIVMFNLFDYGNPVGMTVALPGAGWMGGGWIGVVLYCGLWGYVLGWLYRKIAAGPQTAFQIVAYMTLLSSLIIGFRDGTLVTVARQNVFFMAPILLWLLFARWSGVRSATEVRRLTATQGGSSASTSSQQPVPGLPPAVARRRAALAADQAGATPAA